MAVTNQGRLWRQKADEAILQAALDLAGGGAKDFAEYRWHVGYIAGIKAAITILEDLEKE